jgi:predicted ester cyclase
MQVTTDESQHDSMIQSELASISPYRSVRVDGRRLRELRIRNGLTQEALAASVGYSDRLVRKLESGGPIQYRTLTDFISYFRDSLQLELQSHGFLSPLDRPGNIPTLAQLMPLWLDGIFNQRDRSLVEQFVHPDLKLHADGNVLHGRQAFQKRLEPLLEAFEPCQLTIEHLVVDASSVCVYWKACKIHRGEFLGVAPTGRPVQIAGNMLAVFSKGMIVEIRDRWELQNLFGQLKNRQP